MSSDSDQDLLKAFIAEDGRKPPVRDEKSAELVARLRRHFVWHISRHWPSLVRRYDDLEAAAFTLLMEWRAEHRLIDSEILWSLAQRLANEVARIEVRAVRGTEARVAGLLHEEPDQPASPEEDASGKELLARIVGLFALLAPGYARALEAFVAHEQGSGPPVAEALECDPETARRTINRARIALAAIALEHGLGPGLKQAGLKRFGGSK